MSSRKMTFIMEVTNGCNLSCAYCYMDASVQHKPFVMSQEVLETLIKKAAESSEQVRFIWHGGEPLLAGLDFYRTVLSLQEKYFEGKVQNTMQTNGTLLTEEMLSFFSKNNFHLGVSLDGDREIHDKMRPYPDGKSSHGSVMSSIQMLKADKVTKRAGTILVLNKKHLEDLQGLYEFYKNHDIPVKINPIVPAGRIKEKEFDLLISPVEYGEAMVTLFDLWYHSSSFLRVNPFMQIVKEMLTGRSCACSSMKTCVGSFFSVSPEGDLYHCGKFVGDKDFSFGNIADIDFHSLRESEFFSELESKTSSLPPSCKACEFGLICNSGCSFNAHVGGDVSDKDCFCDGYRILYKHIHTTLKEELGQYFKDFSLPLFKEGESRLTLSDGEVPVSLLGCLQNSLQFEKTLKCLEDGMGVEEFQFFGFFGGGRDHTDHYEHSEYGDSEYNDESEWDNYNVSSSYGASD